MTMTASAIKQANKLMKSEGVQWVQGQFADLLGGLRSFTSPAVEYTGGDLWKNGISFDHDMPMPDEPDQPLRQAS